MNYMKCKMSISKWIVEIGKCRVAELFLLKELKDIKLQYANSNQIYCFVSWTTYVSASDTMYSVKNRSTYDARYMDKTL